MFFEPVEMKSDVPKKYNYEPNNFRDDADFSVNDILESSSENSNLNECRKKVKDFFKVLRSIAYKEEDIFGLIDQVKKAYETKDKNPETAKKNFNLYLHGLFYYTTHIDWEYKQIINLINHSDFFYKSEKEITFGYDPKTYYNMFHTAVFSDQPAYFKQMFSQMKNVYGEKESINIYEHYLFKQEKRKLTPFHLACLEGKLKIVEYLLTDLPTPLKARCQDILFCPSNINPFILACKRGQLGVVKYLLSIICKRIAPNSIEFQKTFLEKSLRSGTSGLLEVISEDRYWFDADENQPDFIKTVEYLFETAFNSYGKNTREFESQFLTQEDEKGNTILTIACQLQKKRIVRVILTNSEKFYNQSPDRLLQFINKKDSKGYSPIQIAARNGDKDIVDLIAHYGVSKSQYDKDGYSVYDHLMEDNNKNRRSSHAKYSQKGSNIARSSYAFYRNYNDLDSHLDKTTTERTDDFDSLLEKKQNQIKSSSSKDSHKRKYKGDEQNDHESRPKYGKTYGIK